MDNKKAFVNGIYAGLGLLLIVTPILGIGIVQATNFSQFTQSKSTFAPNANVYIFEQREVDNDVATILDGTVKTLIKNYRTANGKMVDIVILDSAKTATPLQQSNLQAAYPSKIITGTTTMPAPLVAPLPIIKGDVIK